MSIRINSVTVTPNETTVGEPVVIAVFCEEITWENLTADFTNWAEVRRSFSSWEMVKNYIRSTVEPEVDGDCIYTSDGDALFDMLAVQISVTGGATLSHSGDTVNTFIKEMLNE